MTKVEIINALESGDPSQIVNFALMNNPEALLTSLKVAGYSPKIYDDVRGIMSAIVSQGNQEQFMKILNAVPYLNDAKNDTAGMREYFVSKLSPEERSEYVKAEATKVAQRTTDVSTETPTPSTGNAWLSIGSGIVGVVGSIFGAKQAAQQATAAQQAAALQAAQTKKILTIGGIVLGALVIIFIGFFLLRKKQK